MYYLINNPDTTPGVTFHKVVAAAIYRGGWVFVDGEVNGAVVTSWPRETESPTIADGDFVVLRSPEPGLAGCGDVVRLEVDVSGAELEVQVHRSPTVVASAWDLATHLPIVGAISSALVPVDLTLAPTLAAFTQPATFVLAMVDATSDECAQLRHISWLESFVTRTGPAAYGQGDDPYPLSTLETEFSVPSAVVQLMDESNAWDTGDITVPAPVAYPITYGSGVPVYPAAKAMLTMSALYLRGACPNLYATAQSAALGVVQDAATGAQCLTLGPVWSGGAVVAVGPI